MKKVLFLSANPQGTDPLKLIRECNNIKDKIRSAGHAGQFDFEQRHEASITALQRYLLEDKPQIVHFSGHGTSQGTLLFQGSEDQPEEVRVRAISNLFKILNERKSIPKEQKIQCVVLNACYSQKMAKAIAKYVDCVVGMSNEVRDDAANAFAESFYYSLASGESVNVAFELGKNQVEMLNIPGQDIPKLECREGVDPDAICLITEEKQYQEPKIVEKPKEPRRELETEYEREEPKHEEKTFQFIGKWKMQIFDPAGSVIFVDLAADGTMEGSQNTMYGNLPFVGTWYFDPSEQLLEMHGVLMGNPFSFGVLIQSKQGDAYHGVGTDGFRYILTRVSKIPTASSFS